MVYHSMQSKACLSGVQITSHTKMKCFGESQSLLFPYLSIYKRRQARAIHNECESHTNPSEFSEDSILLILPFYLFEPKSFVDEMVRWRFSMKIFRQI